MTFIQKIELYCLMVFLMKKIVRKLTLFHNYFAKIYSITVNQEDFQIKYVVEKMIPLVNKYNSKLSKYLCSARPWESLFLCFRFGINCLMSLHLLHEQVRIVHSDISARNIMFSFQDGCWKLIDFNQSLEIRESLETPRKLEHRGLSHPNPRKQEYL
jgi:serine/threonine protein kinase